MSNTVEELTGQGDLSKVRLTRRSGASCEVYLYGAHLASWKAADGVERIYMSPLAEFEKGKAIRGGIPICWPQFSGRGPYGKHGFARNTASWKVRRLVPEPNPSVTLELRDCVESQDYPFSFVLTYTVTLDSDNSLVTTLHVVNQSDDPMDFTTALHTYFSVSDVTQIKVSGLQGLKYEDNAKGGVHEFNEEQLTIEGEVDCVYLNTPDEVSVIDGDVTISVQKRGFPDAVIWNIGEAKAPSIKDMGPGDWQKYVCVEAGAIGSKVVVPAGDSWSAEQRFVVSRSVQAATGVVGETDVGMTEQRLQEIEEAFKAKAAGSDSLSLADAYEIMFSREEKSEYSWKDFSSDIKEFEAQMADKERLSWPEIKAFFDTLG